MLKTLKNWLLSSPETIHPVSPSMMGQLPDATLIVLKNHAYDWLSVVLQAIHASAHPMRFIETGLEPVAKQLRHCFATDETVLALLDDDLQILLLFLVRYYDPVSPPPVLTCRQTLTDPSRYPGQIHTLLQVSTQGWVAHSETAETFADKVRLLTRLQTLVVPLMTPEPSPLLFASTSPTTDNPLQRFYQAFCQFIYSCYVYLSDWWTRHPAQPLLDVATMDQAIVFGDTLVTLLQTLEGPLTTKTALDFNLIQHGFYHWYQQVVAHLDSRPYQMATFAKKPLPTLTAHWWTTPEDDHQRFIKAWTSHITATVEALNQDLRHLAQRTHCAFQQVVVRGLIRPPDLTALWVAYCDLQDQSNALSAAAWAHRTRLAHQLQCTLTALEGLTPTETRRFYLARLQELDSALLAIHHQNQHGPSQLLARLTAQPIPSPSLMAARSYLTFLATTTATLLPIVMWLEQSCHQLNATEQCLADEMTARFQTFGVHTIDYHDVHRCVLLTDSLIATLPALIATFTKTYRDPSHPDKHRHCSVMAQAGFVFLDDLLARLRQVNRAWRHGQWATRPPKTTLLLTTEQPIPDHPFAVDNPLPLSFDSQPPLIALNLSVLALKTTYSQALTSCYQQQGVGGLTRYLHKDALGYPLSHSGHRLYEGPPTVAARKDWQESQKIAHLLHRDHVLRELRIVALRQEIDAAVQQTNEAVQQTNEDRRLTEEMMISNQEMRQGLRQLYQEALLAMLTTHWQTVTNSLPNPITPADQEVCWQTVMANCQQGPAYQALYNRFKKYNTASMVVTDDDWPAFKAIILSAERRSEKDEAIPSSSPRPISSVDRSRFFTASNAPTVTTTASTIPPSIRSS